MKKEITRFQFQDRNATMFITDEYERFKFIKGNRNPELATESNKHSRRIVESIKRNGYLLTTITVNEKWELIDGQHRIAALRELNLPALVIKIDGYHDREMQIINMTSEDWNQFNHAHYWSVMGVKDYTDLLEMWREFPKLTIGTTATLLSNAAARQPHSFDDGNWKITKDLKTMRANLALLMDLWPIQRKITNRSPAEAFMEVVETPKYSHKRMKENLEAYGKRYWENYHKKSECLMMFTDIYNHARKTNNLNFAKQKDFETVAKARMKRAA